MKSDQLELGSLITTPQNKDAIHIAVMPVTAVERTKAGDYIKIAYDLEDGSICVEKSDSKKQAIGIVDPFLEKVVQEHQTFWMFLMPYTITSLRHDWTHPEIKSENKEMTRIEIDDYKEKIKKLEQKVSNLKSTLEDNDDRYGCAC